jgi:predicted O-methyltransferase YrrM
MKILNTLVCCLLFSAALSSQEIPEPYCSIADLPFDPHGWFGNAQHLEPLLKVKPAKIVVEVGSWLGCSTRFLATTVPDDGIVYAVDTWAGSPQEAVHMQDPRLPYLYQLFLSNVKHAGLASKIVPFRMKSVEASWALNVIADLIYLDGAHDTESVIQDIRHWYPHLDEDGIMCGDDWLWDTVRAAVVECAGDLGVQVRAVDNFWWYEKR